MELIMRNFPTFLAILVGFLALFCTSCRTPKPIKLPDPSPAVETAVEITEKSAEKLKNVSEEVTKSAKNIKKETQDLDDTLPTEVKPLTTGHLRKINKEADSITVNADRVAQVGIQLTTAKKKLEKSQISINKQEKLILKLTEERDKAIAQRDSALQKSLMYLVLLGVVLIGISGVLIYNGNGKAISIAVGGFLLIAISLAISFFIKYLAIIGIIFAGIVFLIIAYEIYKRQKKHAEAFDEVVHTNEIVKEKLDDTVRDDIFGSGATPGKVESIQSKDTKELVQASRSRFRTQWEPTIKK
jgi:lipopolysaccharide export LptBFGC system permease protein LptF